MSNVDGARAIMQHTLDTLIERERKLARLHNELTETRAAIKALRKHLGVNAPAQIPERTGPKAAGTNPRARFTDRVIDIVRAAGRGMTYEEIARALEKPEDDQYLRSILDQALAREQLVDTPLGLAVPA